MVRFSFQAVKEEASPPARTMMGCVAGRNIKTVPVGGEIGHSAAFWGAAARRV